MKQIQIIKDSVNLDCFQAETEAELMVWLQVRRDHKVFGNDEYSYQVEVSPAVMEVKEIQIIDEIETEVVTQEYQPAVFETINIPAEYEIEITDITAQVELDRIKQEKLNQIAQLESQITPRRYREAILSGDHSFIETIELEISIIRDTLQ